MDAQLLHPHPYLLRRGVAAVLAFFVPAFGVLYFVTVPGGPWAVVLTAQIAVAVAASYCFFAYARLGVAVTATSISERGFFGIVRRYDAEQISAIVLVNTFRGGSIETVPQLFVCDLSGRQVIRLRGQFWSRDTMTTVAETLDVRVTQIENPISTSELHATYPSLLYWFERRPIVAAIGFGGVLLAGGAGLYAILALLGETA